MPLYDDIQCAISYAFYNTVYTTVCALDSASTGVDMGGAQGPALQFAASLNITPDDQLDYWKLDKWLRTRMESNLTVQRLSELDSGFVDAVPEGITDADILAAVNQMGGVETLYNDVFSSLAADLPDWAYPLCDDTDTIESDMEFSDAECSDPE